MTKSALGGDLMNIYVIYKFHDYKVVKETVDKICAAIPSDNRIFMFDPDPKPKLWRARARKKLKDSQMVLLFDSVSGGKAEVGRHISWELKYAAKQEKKVVILKTDPLSVDRTWYEYDYSEQDPRLPKYKTIPISDAVSFMQRECGWQIDKSLLHTDSPQALTAEQMQILLQQYQIMVDTSEKLMERRQATTNLYTTLSTTLIALIGASFAFENVMMCAAILLASGLILILLCRNWKLSLDAYDLNNTGKFAVINLLEKHLPAEIFECEYRYNKQRGMRSFSTREKHLPRIFTCIGGVLIAISAAIFLNALLVYLGVFPAQEPKVTEACCTFFQSITS